MRETNVVNLIAVSKLSVIREINTRVYGKRQRSDSRLRFLKMNNTYTRMVQLILMFVSSTKLLTTS